MVGVQPDSPTWSHRHLNRSLHKVKNNWDCLYAVPLTPKDLQTRDGPIPIQRGWHEAASLPGAMNSWRILSHPRLNFKKG